MGCAVCTSNNSLCLSVADSSFEAEFLQAHNAYRKHHGAPPLTINKNLCRSSQEWAKHLLSIRTLKHSNGDYGENVYYAWSSANKNLTGQSLVATLSVTFANGNFLVRHLRCKVFLRKIGAWVICFEANIISLPVVSHELICTFSKSHVCNFYRT